VPVCSVQVSARLRGCRGQPGLRLGVTGSASLSLRGRLRLTRDPGLAGPAAGAAAASHARACGRSPGSESSSESVCGTLRPAGGPVGAAAASRHRRARPSQTVARCCRPGAGGGKPPPPAPPLPPLTCHCQDRNSSTELELEVTLSLDWPSGCLADHNLQQAQSFESQNSDLA
jgi:hypothetical protein